MGWGVGGGGGRVSGKVLAEKFERKVHGKDFPAILVEYT